MEKKLTPLFSLMGITLTLSEIIMKMLHSKLCSTKGCLLISQSVKYSDNIIVIIGLIVFVAIFFLSISKMHRSSFFINQLLIVSLSAEGVFVGYQLFRIKHLCLFCISVFGIFVIISIIRLIQKELSVATGFVSFFIILSLFYILKPAGIPVPNLNKPLVLIYKTSCPHCEKVIREAKKNKINICTIKADNCFNMLKSLNINEVPLLIVSKKNEKKIIIGEQKILQYLLSNKTTKKNNLYNSLFKDKNSFCTIGEKCK